MSSVLLITPEQHFNELLKEACDKLDFKIAAASQSYILNLLKFYIDSRNLYSPFINVMMFINNHKSFQTNIKSHPINH